MRGIWSIQPSPIPGGRLTLAEKSQSAAFLASNPSR
jgi:hypothetical protein